MQLTKQFFKILFVFLTGGLAFSEAHATVTLKGAEGPIRAEVTINDRGYASMRVIYTGYLFYCASWNYGHIPADVNIVYVTENEHGERTSHLRRMGGTCESYGHVVPNQTVDLTYSSDRDGLFNAIFRDQDLYGDEIHVELAFERNGYWDSRYGENYRVKLTRQD